MLMNLERPVSCNLGVGDGKQGPKIHPWFSMTSLFCSGLCGMGRAQLQHLIWEWELKRKEKLNFPNAWLVPSAELET